MSVAARTGHGQHRRRSLVGGPADCDDAYAPACVRAKRDVGDQMAITRSTPNRPQRALVTLALAALLALAVAPLPGHADAANASFSRPTDAIAVWSSISVADEDVHVASHARAIR